MPPGESITIVIGACINIASVLLCFSVSEVHQCGCRACAHGMMWGRPCCRWWCIGSVCMTVVTHNMHGISTTTLPHNGIVGNVLPREGTGIYNMTCS